MYMAVNNVCCPCSKIGFGAVSKNICNSWIPGHWSDPICQKGFPIGNYQVKFIINFYLKPRFILWKINFWNRVPDIICDSSVGTEGPSNRLPPVTGSS